MKTSQVLNLIFLDKHKYLYIKKNMYGESMVLFTVLHIFI